MEPLIALCLVSCIAALTFKIIKGDYQIAYAGRIGLAAMFILTAIGHCLYATGMSMMLPDVIPFKIEIVYLTGVMEILFAIGLLINKVRNFTAWLIIVFLILVLPANIYAATVHLDLVKATYDGDGMAYLWFRIPEQILFILWAYFSAIKY